MVSLRVDGIACIMACVSRSGYNKDTATHGSQSLRLQNTKAWISVGEENVRNAVLAIRKKNRRIFSPTFRIPTVMF